MSAIDLRPHVHVLALPSQAEKEQLDEREEKLRQREERIERLNLKLRSQRDKLRAAQAQARDHVQDYEVGRRVRLE